MGNCKTKFLSLLVVFFAGFATAIYSLAPAPQIPYSEAGETTMESLAINSNQFAQSFNVGMHKCLNFAKDAAWRANVFLKQKLDETKTDG